MLMSEFAAICSAFPDADFARQERASRGNCLEQRELIQYMSLPERPTNEVSDSTSISNDTASGTFPPEREAGKILMITPFHRARHPKYNFFHPFPHILDYKLARFFHAAHVPKTRIDEFFNDGFIGK